MGLRNEIRVLRMVDQEIDRITLDLERRVKFIKQCEERDCMDLPSDFEVMTEEEVEEKESTDQFFEDSRGFND